MTGPFPMRAVGLLTLCAVAWHGLWALTIPEPVDWDPAYYLDVAKNIVAGRGAVSSVVWHGSGPHLPLPQPADLHWMPLPSRVLVPFVALGDAWGAQMAAVLGAASWTPIAAWLAHRLRSPPRQVLQAAVLAGLGGGYVRFLSTPDSIAWFGLFAGVGWIAALERKSAVAVAVAALAALTRGDGFLLAPCLGWVLWMGGARRGGVLTAAAGPLAFGVWTGRNLVVAGAAWWVARQKTANAGHIHDLLRGTSESLGFVDRLAAVGEALSGALTTAALVGVVLLPVLAGVGAMCRRRHPLVLGVGMYAGLMVGVPAFLAPGVAASGTVFRSGAAVFPVGCALAVVGVGWLSELGHRHRGYPLWLLPIILGVGFLLGTVGLGGRTAQLRPRPPVICPEGAAGARVLTGRPLLVRATCGPEAVAMFRGEAAETVLERAERYRVFVAWLPDTDPDPLVPTAADAPQLLPGWTLWMPGVWLHPDAPSPTTAPEGW